MIRDVDGDSGNEERDRYSDTSRDGSGQLQKKDVGFILDFGPTTVADEARKLGYENNDTPFGAPPRPQRTSGMRGASDSGRY